ncbi:hypothetical protein Hanom_Chr16g01452781 [Helianthus anomalus]
MVLQFLVVSTYYKVLGSGANVLFTKFYLFIYILLRFTKWISKGDLESWA